MRGRRRRRGWNGGERGSDAGCGEQAEEAKEFESVHGMDPDKYQLARDEWNEDPAKSEYENKANQEWCALKSTAKKIKGEIIIDEDTGLPKTDENDKKVFKEDTYKIELEGYHLKEPQKTKGKLLPTLAKLNFGANWDKIKLVELLKMYCLQDKTKERPSQFKGSYLEILSDFIFLFGRYINS